MFQMAPTRKILMSYGSKKGTWIYFPFLSKSPSKGIPYRFPIGAPIERDAHLQVIFTYLLIYPFITEALRKEHPSMFPKSRAPKRSPPHRASTLNLSRERCSIPTAPLIHLSKSLIDEPPFRFLGSTPEERDGVS
jgi:hypothetical protein